MVLRMCDIERSQRPRERLLDLGPAALADAELLAVLLRSGPRGLGALGLGHALLSEAGGLLELARADLPWLRRLRGLGPAGAAAVAAALELGRRLGSAELRAADRLDRPEAVGPFLARRLAAERQEVVGLVSLDGRHRFLASHVVARGTRDQAPVEPGEVFRRALLDEAAGLVLFHNHPSGDLEPSRDDLELTRRLVEGGRMLSVQVLDHVIVAASRWLSLRVTRPEIFAQRSAIPSG